MGFWERFTGFGKIYCLFGKPVGFGKIYEFWGRFIGFRARFMVVWQVYWFWSKLPRLGGARIYTRAYLYAREYIRARIYIDVEQENVLGIHTVETLLL